MLGLRLRTAKLTQFMESL